MSRPFNSRPFLRRLLVASILLLTLTACASGPGSTRPTTLNGTAPELRQLAAQAIDEKRYQDATQALRQAAASDPANADYLLLGNLQEALEQYRPAQKSYQSGLAHTSNDDLQQKLYFHWATLEALELNHPSRAADLAIKLPVDSDSRLNLQILQAMQQNHYDAALRLAQQLSSRSDDKEMIGWAHYHAARAWVAVGNNSKAFEALFHAINHARGHGLVARITRLWDDLRQLPPLP